MNILDKITVYMAYTLPQGPHVLVCVNMGVAEGIIGSSNVQECCVFSKYSVNLYMNEELCVSAHSTIRDSCTQIPFLGGSEEAA